MATSKRVTISLPTEIVDDISYIASRLGISRSAFLAQLLTEADLGKIRSLLSTIPDAPSEGDARRFRGESRQYVKERMDRLQSMQGGLFDGSSD